MRLSASQIQTYVDCERKWGWRYVAKIESPPNAAAELGTNVHAQLATHLLGGEIDFTTEVGYIAASGLQHLPPPGTPGMLVEMEFHFEGLSGHSYLGYKDLEIPGVIFDHKSTSDLKWQKTEQELEKDIQAILYAVDYFRTHPTEEYVELRWVYYQTRGTKKSAVTKVRLTQHQTWQRFIDIEAIAKRMEVSSEKQPLEMTPTSEHCGAYAGCPYQGNCNLSPLDKMRAHMENKLLASIKKNGVAGAVPALASPTNKLLAKLQGNGAPTATVAPAAINPPEYQPPPAAAAPVPPPAPAPAGDVAATSRELATSLSAPAGLVAAPTVTPGRGRPKKATVPATGVVPKIDTLYLNCGPVGVAVTDGNDVIVLAKKRVTEAAGLADYRFADFGQGPGMLAVAAGAELDALEGILASVRLDTHTPEGQAVVVEFIARANLVVR
jgi:hypothetical protein